MRYVAIHTGPETYLDHLGVLSSLLNIPLIVTEEKTFDFAKVYYPDLDVSLKGLDELSIGYLAENFDAIFETGKFWAADLGPFIELLHRKKMRFVFCPHGNSDKGHSLQNHVDQDVSLIYGNHLKDLLHCTKAAEKIKHFVRTGNYRYPYYLKHKAFFDSLAEKKVFQRFQDPKKSVILYAPTWQDKENPTLFFSSIDILIEQLSINYNLLIKLHPFLLGDFPAQIYHVMMRYQHHPSVVFLTDFPPIYPLLARCDLYLGDYSSIGYDFLVFDKPLFFLNPKGSPTSSLLHTCGIQIPSKLSDNLNDFFTATAVESKTLYSEQRKKVYSYAFGNEIPIEQMRDSIFAALR